MSMTNKELIQQRRKEFREYAVPMFPVGLTHRIEIDNQAYQLVGQQTMKSMMFTNYHIVDERGDQAPADIRTTVFTYIARFQFTEQFLSCLEFIEGQAVAREDDEVDQVLAHDDVHVRKNIEFLLSQNEQLVDILMKMREEIRQLAGSGMTWNLDSLQRFDELWEQIKRVYEQRIPAIMKFREFVLNEALVDSLPNGLAQLYEEGKSLYQFFYETISTNPARLKDLDAFIELNGVLGYVDETVPEQNIFSMWDKVASVFLRRFSYVIVMLGFIGLTIKNGFDIMTTLYALFFLSVSFSLHLLNNSTMLSKVYTETNKQRELRMTEEQEAREQYRKAYEAPVHDPADETDEREVVLETVTARHSILVTIIGAIIFIYATLVDDLGDTIEMMIALGGFLIVIVGLLLPKQTPSKRNVILTGSGISRGRMTIEREHMVRVESKGKGKKYEIHSKNAQYTIKFRAPKAKIKQTKAELKSWCERHLIEFEE